MFTNFKTNLSTPLSTVIDKMDLLTKTIHELLITGDFLTSNSRNIESTINHMIERGGLEMIDKAFVSKLSYKLPKLPLNDFNKFQKAKAQINFAIIITQFLIEEGTIRIREEVKRSREEDAHGNRPFTKTRYLVFDSEVNEKNLLADIQFKPRVLVGKGVTVKVGAKEVKYTGPQKEYLRELSSQAFKLSDYANYDLLMKGYTLSKGYQSTQNGKSKELPVMAERRYKAYARAVMHIRTIGEFYLTNWFDSRERMYYHTNLEGIRPQGKLWETLMIDIATPYIIDENGHDELIHILMVTLKGRMTMEQALDMFEDSHMEEASSINPMEQTTQDEFGEAILLNKLAMAHEQYLRSEPCYFIFGKDLTNSGVGIAGNAFRSAKMMNAGNYGGTDEAVDSHTSYATGYGLERNLIKSAHTGLLHGSTFKSMADMLKDTIVQKKVDAHEQANGEFRTYEDEDTFKAEVLSTLDYLTTQYVKDASIKSYGAEVLNIDAIASWGGDIVDNENTTLLWTTTDGWKSQSTAYMERVPLTIYSVSTKSKSGYSTWSLTSDMPLITANGQPVYGKDDGVIVKKRGLYASITHSSDGTLLRSVIRHALAKNYAGMYKHDDYMLPLNAFKGVRDVVRNFMEEVRANNPYESALKEIAESHTRNIKVPSMLIGNAENTIQDSNHFLMP